MLSYLLLALAAYLVYFAVDWYRRFTIAVNNAKATGIPYVIVPLYFLNTWWLVSHRLLLPLLKHVPAKYTAWVDLLLPEFSFDYSHEIFERVGSDTFMTVAAGGNVLYTADPAVITQITSRRNDFPKPIHIYRSVDIYGKNVVSTEGQEWRFHRKATSPPFTEKNNHLVWNESIHQAQAMLQSWVGPDGRGGQTVDRVMDDTMRLSLHVISRAGFGRHLEWPTDDTKAKEDADYVDPSKIKNEADAVDAGHQMSYTYAIHCLLDNILFQFLVPRWALKYSPLTVMRKANDAYVEWGNYMAEMVSAKKKQLQDDPENAGQMDIVGQLVKGQVAEQLAHTKDQKGAGGKVLSDEEILGNSFVMILAGHETAANSIHFAILYLALFPRSQRRLQHDLDTIFAGRPPSEWDYERDLPALFGGMTGAILNEELRLIPPVLNIPKSTFGVPDQPLTVNGKRCTVPANTYIQLCAVSAQKNPKYWPAAPPTNPGGRPVHPRANTDNDLEEFRPERWLLDHNTSHSANGTTAMPNEKLDSENIGVNESADTSDTLYRPVRGSYIPFSDGYRACLGRRFAQVEVLVTLATLFQKYSVELAVDEFASDAEVEQMDEEEKARVWQSAAEQARDRMLNGMGVVITLQMRRGTVKVRFAPRGQETFAEDIDLRARRYGLKPGEKAVSDQSWRAWSGGLRHEIPVQSSHGR